LGAESSVVEGEKNRRKEGEDLYIVCRLKAAFDNVDRELPWKEMRSKRINEQLLGRIEKIYGDTEVMVRTRQGYTEGFKTKKVRQGCVMSPIFFNVYLAEIDDRIKARGYRGCRNR